MPIRRRLNFSDWSSSTIERSPFCPPWLPPSRNRSLPNGSAKSSATMSRSLERRVVAGERLADREPGLVHVGQRLHERDIETAIAAADDVRGVALAAATSPPGSIREPVHDHPADVVPGARVLRTGVPETHHQLHPYLRRQPNRARSRPGGPVADGTAPRQALSGSVEESALELPHRRLLDRLRVVPAADVERAVDAEQPEFVGRRPAHVTGLAATPLDGLLDRPLDRDDDVAEMGPAARRKREGGVDPCGRGRRRDAAGTPRAARAGRTGRRSGRPCPCARRSAGQLVVIGEDESDRRGCRGAGRAEGRRHDRASTAALTGGRAARRPAR